MASPGLLAVSFCCPTSLRQGAGVSFEERQTSDCGQTHEPTALQRMQWDFETALAIVLRVWSPTADVDVQ